MRFSVCLKLKLKQVSAHVLHSIAGDTVLALGKERIAAGPYDVVLCMGL